MFKIPQFAPSECQGCGAKNVEPVEIGRRGKVVKNMCPVCHKLYDFVEDKYGDILREASFCVCY